MRTLIEIWDNLKIGDEFYLKNDWYKRIKTSTNEYKVESGNTYRLSSIKYQEVKEVVDRKKKAEQFLKLLIK